MRWSLVRARYEEFTGGMRVTPVFAGPIQRRLTHIHGRSRQQHLERGAASDLRVQPDVSAGLLHDPVHGREPESRSLAGLLRREEGLEDAQLDVLGYADAGILDGKHGILPFGNQLSRRGPVVRPDLEIRRAEIQVASRWHRVSRVDGEVHDD